MANRKKKKSKLLKAKRKRYRAGKKAERLDMRQGGRVRYQTGGPRGPMERDIRDVPTGGSFSVSREEDNILNSPKPIEMGRPPQDFFKEPVPENEPQPIEYTDTELGKEININPDNIRVPGSPPVRVPPGPPNRDTENIDDGPTGGGSSIDRDDSKDNRVPYMPVDSVTTPVQSSTRPIIEAPTAVGKPQQRYTEDKERMKRSASRIEQAAEGRLPESAVLQDAVKTEVGTPMSTTQMADPTIVSGTKAELVDPEKVTTVQDTSQITSPEQIQAAQMEAAQIDKSPEVLAAQGEVRDESLAKAANVDRVSPIESAKVEIPVGALQEQVTGSLSPEAKATAALNTGSSLRKLSRAKKQLRKAGLTEDQINEIGDDIEALEDRLDDFTEEQRGLIAGVDRDTLVDAQMGRLLDGIEEGQIPLWAQGAVGRVEQMLASRGLSASSVGRAELTNAILQAALPMAQSNATALQQAATQQRDIEARESESNAARRQQTALTNANNVFQMDMANFSAEVQRQASNSKFLQTVGLQEASFEQQGIVQDALLMSQANLAEADFYQKAQIQNAQAFLQTDMANLNNLQQANVLKAQQEQQRLLSNQSSQNAARNANMVSENQTQQFMAGLNAQTKQFNAQQSNAMKQFNAAAENSAAARDANRNADMNKFNAQLLTQVEEFNSQQDFARNQWEAQNAAVVEASNIEWRRKVNTINTAAQNQVNMQNAMNAYGLSTQSLSFLWQELRDNADYDFRSAENAKAQVTQLRATAIANEAALAEKSKKTIDQIVSIAESMIKSYYDTGG